LDLSPANKVKQRTTTPMKRSRPDLTLTNEAAACNLRFQWLQIQSHFMYNFGSPSPQGSHNPYILGDTTRPRHIT